MRQRDSIAIPVQLWTEIAPIDGSFYQNQWEILSVRNRRGFLPNPEFGPIIPRFRLPRPEDCSALNSRKTAWLRKNHFQDTLLSSLIPILIFPLRQLITGQFEEAKTHSSPWESHVALDMTAFFTFNAMNHIHYPIALATSQRNLAFRS